MNQTEKIRTHSALAPQPPGLRDQPRERNRYLGPDGGYCSGKAWVNEGSKWDLTREEALAELREAISGQVSPLPRKEIPGHTPGRWIANGDLPEVAEGYREDRYIVTEDFDEDLNQGSIIGVLRGHGPTLRANARLITAAPELLRTLKGLLALLDEGLLVRGISQDAGSGWHINALRIAVATSNAVSALNLAEKGAE
jgi:hypothetical protein